MRKAKKATPVYLERVALWYLERYGGTEARLRRVLQKRVRRSVEELGTERQEGEQALESVVSKLKRMGYIDDARIAKGRAQALSRRGKSKRAIMADLRAKGVGGEEIAAAVEDLAPEEEAALRFAKSKRLGPFAREEKDADGRRKELAKMARAGFSYAIARAVLEKKPDEV